MTYPEMCRYIVAKEGFIWEEFLLASKKRDQEYRSTRQICFYLAYVFFKNMSYREAGAIFGKDHATAIHAVSVVTKDMKTNVDLRRKIKGYCTKLEAAIYSEWPTNKADADEILDGIHKAMQQMKIIAEAYCKITGKRLV
jgi:hypothetical protein